MRTILQSEGSECGLACLAMVADHHGYKLDLYTLRKKFSVSLKGMTLESLIGYAAALDFSTRPLRAEPANLSSLRLPCILHWNLDHFVVLRSVSRSVFGAETFVIVDPAVGERKLTLEEVSCSFTGVVLELLPSPSFQPVEERRKISLADLVGRVFGLRRAVVQLLGLAFALELLAVFGPFFNQIIIDDIVVTGDVSLLNLLLICFGLLMVMQTAVSIFRSWILLRWSASVGVQWATRLLSHLVKLPLSFFERRHMGDIVSRFGSLAYVQSTLSSLFLESLLDVIMVVFASIFMFMYSTTLALATFAAAMLYLILRLSLYPSFKRANHERLLLSAREASFFMETVRGIAPLKLFGVEHDRVQRWQSIKMAVVERDLETQKLDIIFKLASTSISTSRTLLVLYFGARAVIDGELSVGMLMAFSSYSMIFSGRVNNLTDLWIRMKMLSLHNDRIAEIALEERELPPETLSDVSRLEPLITLENVRFRYAQGEPWVIDGVNLTLRPNETAVLVGKSGCGKSTLFKIILGLVPPTEGEVLIDGIPINKIGLQAYRQLIGTVMQDDVLLAGSVVDNISFFSPRIDRQHAVDCAQLAGIHAEICAMPMGYETHVGDMGNVLSAGQRQRVLLARALYKRPKILAIDEGTSHLDVSNERRVNHSISGLALTRLIIAHRPETIKTADRVILLHKGKVLELNPIDGLSYANTEPASAEKFG